MRRVLVSVCAVVSFALAGVASVHASEPVTLAWDANTEPDLAGYIVEYGVTSGQYTQSIQIGKTTQLTVTGLQPDTTYYFVVRAYNTAGATSSPSGQIDTARRARSQSARCRVQAPPWQGLRPVQPFAGQIPGTTRREMCS